MRSTDCYLPIKIIDKKIDRKTIVELLNRMIERSGLSERKGKKVTNIGWEMTRFKDIRILQKGDPATQKIIDEAFKKLLQK